MTATSVDPATGNLLVGGRPVFRIGLSDPPPVGGTAPGGGDAPFAPHNARVYRFPVPA